METEIIRDLLTANMTNDEVQNDLLAETKSPTQAFEYEIRREKGLENQLQIRKQGSTTFSSQQTGIKSEPVGFIQKRGGDSYRNNRRWNRGSSPHFFWPDIFVQLLSPMPILISLLYFLFSIDLVYCGIVARLESRKSICL